MSEEIKAKRRIMCSAIWYDDGKKHPHQPVTTGIVMCGHRHHNIIGQVSGINVMAQEGFIEKEQGFLTNFGEWVTRQAAKHIAIRNGQIKEDDMISSVLTSEDLW